MNTPLVSVIVTSFNHAKFIGSALDSIYAQTWKILKSLLLMMPLPMALKK